jgi:basic membrane protein A
VNGSFPSSYVGTLSNDGVGLAPYHQLAAKVPAQLKSEITQLAKDVISGQVKVASS